jgi:AmmeMemoRadiSam system protein A
MDPGRSPEGDAAALAPDERRTLLEVARRSIAHALRHGFALPLRPEDHGKRLRTRAACFVTLRREGQLRGCVGTLEPRLALVVEVAESAYAAALRDPRFPPLAESELAGLGVEISVLSPLQPFDTTSEAELAVLLRPGIDGLVLQEGEHRGTFLPAVWAELPDPLEFVRGVKRKAGLPPDYWSPGLRASRYTVESIA